MELYPQRLLFEAPEVVLCSPKNHPPKADNFCSVLDV